MGQSRAERTWRTPTTTRHGWLKLDPPVKHPHENPVQCLILAWSRTRAGDRIALIVYVDDVTGPEPVVVQRWVPGRLLRPVPADPNRAFGLR